MARNFKLLVPLAAGATCKSCVVRSARVRPMLALSRLERRCNSSQLWCMRSQGIFGGQVNRRVTKPLRPLRLG